MMRWQRRASAAIALLAVFAIAALATRGQADERAGPETPRFVDVATAAGVEHAYTGDWTHYVGGGVAAFDCDLDGDPDLFFAGGASPAALYRNESQPGTLRFSVIADNELVETSVTGAYPLDIDGDGTLDLAVLRLGANRLYRGLGDCRFAAAGETWGVAGGYGWTTAFSAVWEGHNRLPTLAFGNYVDRDMWAAMHTPFGDSGTGVAPTPACPDNVLFRPAGPEAARYAPAIRLSPGHCPLSMLFTDWSRAGRPDLLVSNDRFYHEDTGEEQLWHLGAEPRLYGRDDGWGRLRIWGMGIASHDITGDGLPDYFLSNMGANRLRTLAPGSTGAPDFREDRLRLRRRGHAPARGPRRAAVHGLALAVRRREQRRLDRPLRRQGQRGGDGGGRGRTTRTTCSSAAPTGASARPPWRRARPACGAAGAAHSSTSTSTACSTSSS